MSSKADYSSMTDVEYDSILNELVGQMNSSQILAYGDVYTALSEELNNEVLTIWEKRNPARTFPSDEVLIKTLLTKYHQLTLEEFEDIGSSGGDKHLVPSEDFDNLHLALLKLLAKGEIKAVMMSAQGNIVFEKEGKNESK